MTLLRGKTAADLVAAGLVRLPRFEAGGNQQTARVQLLLDLRAPTFCLETTRDTEVWVQSTVLEAIDSRLGGMPQGALRLIFSALCDPYDPASGADLCSTLLLGGREALIEMLPKSVAEEVRREIREQELSRGGTGRHYR